mmetsp:Transcript_11039/g.20631  ORF Transcript_11039/g.20631 Transcript_11039/m.20631 type:complete len:128 (-) Transcript_11039:29-412(-)
MGNVYCCTCAEKRKYREGLPVGTYVWQDGFQLQNEPSGKEWRDCKALIENALPVAEEFVREQFCGPRAPDAKNTATRLCTEWVLPINPQIEKAGFILDACGWTQYESNGEGKCVAEPKLALLIKLAY